MKTVVIIGAGPAGLTAAYDLKKQSGNELRVILLEESGEIGGISRTVRHNGCRIDLGGHRFFSKNEQVNALWQEIMPMQGAPSMDDRVLSRDVPLSVGGPDPEREDRVMLSRHRVSRIYYLQKFFDYPISVKPQTFINMGFARTMKSGFGYLAARMHKLPVTSLENFYINQFGRPLYEMFFEHYTENLWGVHPSQIAPDWGAQRVKGLSLMKVFTSAVTKPFRKENGRVETSLIERFSYPKYGPGQFWETMAADAQKLGAELKMNTRAVGFTRDENGRIASVIAEGADGVRAEIPCDAVFSSMPIKDLAEAMPGMPEDVKAVAAALPYRDFMTVGLLVDKLKIKNETKLKTLGNIVPDCWIYIHDRSAKIGRMQIFNNWSPYMVKDPEHTVWGVHPSQIAPDWGAQRVKGLSLMKVFTSAVTKPFRKENGRVETSLIERFSYPKYGPGQFWETMAADAQKLGAELKMNTRAVGFTRDENGRIASVIAEGADGVRAEIPCDAVFSSMPIKDLAEAMPGMPEDVKAVAAALPYRDFMTVGLLVDKLKIKNETKLKTLGNIVPDCWIYIHDRSAKIGRMQIFNNWSPYMVKDPEHTVWIGLEYFCNEGDEMWAMSDEDFIRMATEEVERIGILEAGCPVRDSIRIRVKKAYPAYFGAYAQMDKVRGWLCGIDNLYCIGRNGQHRYNNMDHSMLTALTASQLYRSGSSEKAALWNINTEESYHEDKDEK